MTNLVPLAEVANLKLALPSDDGWVNTMTWVPVSHTELHLCSRYYPVVVRLFGGVPCLGLLVSERHLSRPLVDASGKWQGAYKPIALRCFPFQVGEIGEDPLKDLLIAPGSQYLRKDAGTAIVGDDGKASPFITEIHRLLRLLQDARRTLAGALDQILIGNLLVPLEDHEAKPKGGQGTTYYTVDRSRFGHVDKPALGALARQNFLGIDVAVSCLFSQDLLRPELLSKPSTAAAAKAQAFPAARSVHELIGIEDFSLVLDDGELISLTDIRAMRVETQEKAPADAAAIVASDVGSVQPEGLTESASSRVEGAGEVRPTQPPEARPAEGPGVAVTVPTIGERVAAIVRGKSEPRAEPDNRVPAPSDHALRPAAEMPAPIVEKAPGDQPAGGRQRSAKFAPVDRRPSDGTSHARLRRPDKASAFGRRELATSKDVSREMPSAGALTSGTTGLVNPTEPDQSAAAIARPSTTPVSADKGQGGRDMPGEQARAAAISGAPSRVPSQPTPDAKVGLSPTPADQPSVVGSRATPGGAGPDRTVAERVQSPARVSAKSGKTASGEEQATDVQPAAEQSQSEPAAKSEKAATAGQTPQDRTKKISPQISDMIRKLNELQALLRLD